MKEIRELLKRELNISDEEYNRMVEKEKKKISNPEFDYSGLNIESAKLLKMKQLYHDYTKEKWDEVVTSLIGDDGKNIVFGYSQNNRSDYMGIANSFALDPNKTSSIVGTKSHGKIDISRDNFIIFTQEAQNREFQLYGKLKLKQEEVNACTTVEEVKGVEWN